MNLLCFPFFQIACHMNFITTTLTDMTTKKNKIFMLPLFRSDLEEKSTYIYQY